MSPIHVMILDHVSDIGGAELSLEALVLEMPKSVCEYVVALPGAGPFIDRLQRRGVAIERVPLESWRWWVRSRSQWIKFFLTLPKQIISLLWWLRYLHRSKPALIHLNLSRIIEPLIAAYLLQIPVIAHFRDIPSQMRFQFVLGLKGLYLIMNLASVWIANSGATAQEIQVFSKRPVLTVPNGIDLAAFDIDAEKALDVPEALSPARYHVAMFGSLNPWKRQIEFVTLALRILVQRKDITFYLVGSEVDSVYVSQLRRLVNDSGHEEQVRFLGHVQCVPALMRRMTLIVHTMPFESFGRVFLEAMAARRPVVAFNSGGAAEIVIDGETGILISPGDLGAMADAVCRLLDDPVSRERMGEAGRKRVSEHYSLEAHCSAIAQVYEKVLSAK